MGLHPHIMEGLDAMRFENPTPVQAQAIPRILNGESILASAQTGTGKTAAFLLPVLSKIEADPKPGIQCLIVVPTRELALQIDQNLQGLSYFTGVSSMPIYGGGDGTSFDQEKKAIQTGVDVLIATPGRLNSHFNLGYVKTDSVSFFILDEADRMLDMGFIADITRFREKLPKKLQTLMFSATMPQKIRDLAKQIMENPTEINIAISKPAENILQVAYSLYDHQKVALVGELLKGKNLNSVIVFCSTRKAVGALERKLSKQGLSCAAISSDLEQDEREQIMLDFRNRKITVLVATDLVSRGIDIANIELVINYDIPNDAEDYVHRIGRTARADTDGMAITLISPDEQHKFRRIEQLIEKEVRKLPLPEGFEPGPEYRAEGGKPRNNNRHKGGKPRNKFQKSKRKPGKNTSRQTNKPQQG
ncbi:MAG: DEAD/DEAH box helicase [Cryomorphaceae bacterium]|nr:MAG: DEAD/DEAH box helicase [Cryomorphaceae bacterium]